MTFFFDNTFPKRVVTILQVMEVEAVHLQDEFPPETPDAVWLPEVSRRGWVLISGDQMIRRSPAERLAFEKANILAYFMHRQFPRQKLWDQVAWVVKYWPSIEQHAQRAAVGTSYVVSPNGKIEKL